MRRSAIVVGVLVVIAGALVFMRPFATRPREVISATPAAPSLFTPPVPLELKPGAQLCVKDVPIDSESQLARVFMYTYGKPGTPLGVTASGPGYAFRSVQPGGYPEGPLELSLEPPAKALDGQICIKNRGRRHVAIQATPQGQRFSRVQPYLNGFPLEQDVPMTLHERQPKSLLAQMPRAIRHAALFVPPAPWLVWILLALVVLGIPAALFVAVARAAVAAPGAVPEPPRASTVPFRRSARRLRPHGAALLAQARRVPAVGWLALLVVLMIAFTYLWASRMGTFQNDEAQNVYFARWMAHHLPSSLWDFSLLQRGLQRAEIYVLALTLGTLAPPGAFLLAHFINVVAWISAAIPAYLIVRGLGTRARWALLAALLVVTGPWLVISVSFLTEPLAYPASVWLLWASWRAVAEPRPRTQIEALVVLFLALLTRSAFLILIPLLPIVVVAHELRYGRRGGARAIVRRLWSRYAVIVLLVGLGVVVFLLSAAGVLPSPTKLTGSYGTPFSVIWGPFLDKTALYGSRVVVGVGFVAFAVGLPWLVRQFAWPDDERTSAFAVTAVVFIVLLVYSLSPAGPDERYVIYFGPPLIVAAAVAFARRRLAWGWVAVGGLVGALLLFKHGWNPNGGAYGYFVGPAETFYARVGLLHLADYLPGGISLARGAFAVALVATAVCAFAFTRARRARTTLTAVVVFLALLQAAQAYYTTTKFVTEGGGQHPTHAERTWIDQAIYGKATAAIVGLGQGNTTVYDPIWAEIQFWNTSVTSEFAPTPLLVQLPPGDYPGSIAIDQRTGALSSTPALPPYAVIPRGYVEIGMQGTPVAHAVYIPADLVRLAHPLQATFHVDGPSADGYVAPRQTATIRFYRAAAPPAGRACGTLPLVPPSGSPPQVRYRVDGRSGSVPAGATTNVRVPLHFGARPYADVTFSSDAHVKLGDGRVEAMQIGQITLGRC